MTNKQIIIDNVDVSGCEYYFDAKCRCMDATIMQDFYSCPQCSSNPNCSYKQLEQVKQENKRLLEIINAKSLETVDIDSAFEIEKLKEQLQAKEQECEELKENQKLKHDNGYEVGVLEKTIYNLKAENNLFRIGHDNEQARRRKYEQALVEIKVIAQYDVYTSRTDLCLKLNWIKKKISECEVE